MSFFGGFNDPFFGDMHRIMHRQMRDMEQLMDAMMVDPFAMMGPRGPPIGFVGPRQQMIADVGMPGQNIRRAAPRDPMSSMMMPFGGGGLFGGIHNMMQQMDQLQHQVVNDPHSHVYTQSTVVSIAPGADGRPQVYEATDSVRKAGDVKEVRRSVRDSIRGEERMTIGHHIGDRGHVIEKRRDRNSGGRIVEQQEFIGLKEDEAHKFDKEWKHATRRAVSGERFRLDDGPGGRRGDTLAIEAGSGSGIGSDRAHDARRARVAGSDHLRRHSPYQQTPPANKRRIVRVEEPPEEPIVTDPEPASTSRASASASAPRSKGPIIEEIE